MFAGILIETTEYSNNNVKSTIYCTSLQIRYFTNLFMHLSMLCPWGGGQARGGDLTHQAVPREWILTQHSHPWVRIFDIRNFLYLTHVQATSQLVCNNRCIGYAVLVIHQVGHETESVMEIKVCVVLCKTSSSTSFMYRPSVLHCACRIFDNYRWVCSRGGFYVFWQEILSPGSGFWQTFFRKMSNPHPLPDPPPPPQGHSIDRCITLKQKNERY